MNAYQAGQKALCGDYFQYTPSGASQFQKASRWTTVPSRGYVAFFYSKSLGRISHVGIVVTANRKQNGTWDITTIEGNTSSATTDRNGGEVRRKFYGSVTIGGDNWFRGFGKPLYGGDTCSVESVIKMAESQIGYQEKASNKDLESFDKNVGRNNYTKYSGFVSWFATPAQWCAQFVSWCFHQACANSRKQPTGWFQQDDGSWNYRKEDGNLAANEWLHIDGRWYAFLDDGTMVKGWFRSDDLWYYMAEDGGMVSSQWVTDNGKTYYLAEDGVMATNAWVRGEMPLNDHQYIYYFVDGDGVWQPSMDTEGPDLEKYELVK